MTDGRFERLAGYRILYVEDNRDISEEVLFFLEPWVEALYCAYNGEEALAIYEQERPDLIITDIQMPQMNGLEMIETIRRSDRHTPIIITTAFNETDYLLRALNLQVDGYLMKPLDFKELLARLDRVIEPLELRRRLTAKNRELEMLNANLDGIAKEKTQRLEHFYTHDRLTGLENIVKLDEVVKQGEHSFLLLLDLSNFAMMNKQYGKGFADTILKQTAEALERQMRLGTRLFKVESDRFVILSDHKSVEAVDAFCEQLIAYFDTREVQVDKIGLRVGFAIGISRINDTIHPMVNAEYALDICKHLGSRSYYFYDENAESIRQAKETVKWLDITTQLIQNEALIPYVQPMVELGTGKIVKYEVLARGEYEGKIISPLRFLESAERLGLINSVARIMIGKSFCCFEGSDLHFSLNLSKRDLVDPHFIEFLEHKLKRHKIDPFQVTFEILETVTLGEHHDAILERLDRLKRMGFKIAIDDFGIENSSLSRLLEIDFDYIKLDGAFVRELDKKPKGVKILKAIVNMARALNARTVAEFVENEVIYDIVKECGIDLAQGYYVGEPRRCTFASEDDKDPDEKTSNT